MTSCSDEIRDFTHALDPANGLYRCSRPGVLGKTKSSILPIFTNICTQQAGASAVSIAKESLKLAPSLFVLPSADLYFYLYRTQTATGSWS